MNFSFVFCWMLLALFISLSIGTTVKLWSYGFRDLMLILSPLIVIFLLFVLPIFVLNVFLFHQNKLDDKTKENFKKINIDLNNLTLFGKIKVSFILWYVLINQYPLILGITAKILKIVFSGKVLLSTGLINMWTNMAKNISQVIIASSDRFWPKSKIV